MRTRFLAAGTMLFVFLLFAYQCIAVGPVYSKVAIGEREVKIGREASVDIEKECKLIVDPLLVERVERLGRPICAIANTTCIDATYGASEITKFDYKFKIVDDKNVNAFSLPGGFIYVNKGLLDYVQSDDELAAVLAHEVAHAAHHHMAFLMREQGKIDSQVMLVLLAGLLGRVDGNELSNLMIGAQLLRIARTSGYGQKAETDADSTAVGYLAKSGYNPVGMLTFLERLSRDSNGKPTVDMGILQTHPAPRDRCRAVLFQLESRGLPINRRSVTNTLKACVSDAKIEGESASEIRLGEMVVCDVASLGQGLSSKQRADYMALRINQFLDSQPALREVRVSSDGKVVLAGGEPIIVVTRQDCQLRGKPAKEVAAKAADVLRQAIWREHLDRMY